MSNRTAWHAPLCITAFSQDRSGNVALLFGMLIFVIAGSAGLAIDSSRISHMRSLTSAALDAAALATAKSVSLDNASDAELQALALAYFNANIKLKAPQVVHQNFTLEINRDKNGAKLSVDASVPATIGRLFNITQFRTTLEASAVINSRDIELGMALDVSGTMEGAKLIELKQAAKELAEIILDDSRGTSKNKIAIAPYSSSVNAGVFARRATQNSYWSRHSCVTERPGAHAFKDTNPSRSPLSRKTVFCSDSPVAPLTSEKSMIERNIDTLSAEGHTAGHLGIAWAWYLISPNWADVWPSDAEPKQYDDANVLKAIVIMSDGEFDTFYDSRNGGSKKQSLKLCQNIKAANITVFAVAYDLPNHAHDILKACASHPNYFFDAKTGTDLRDAFKAIADELTGLRLSS